MTKTLDVLVLESNHGAADAAIASLEATGHRVHRCHDKGADEFPCNGIAELGHCPLDGNVDVALVVRPRIMRRPTPLEDGVTCAIRAGVPIVEDGPDLDGPFRPWVAQSVRPGTPVTAACVTAADRDLDPLALQITERVAALVIAAGIEPTTVGCRAERDGASLRVQLELPVPVSRAIEHALAVRTLDAVRSYGRTFGDIHVQVSAPEPTR